MKLRRSLGRCIFIGSLAYCGVAAGQLSESIKLGEELDFKVVLCGIEDAAIRLAEAAYFNGPMEYKRLLEAEKETCLAAIFEFRARGILAEYRINKWAVIRVLYGDVKQVDGSLVEVYVITDKPIRGAYLL